MYTCMYVYIINFEFFDKISIENIRSWPTSDSAATSGGPFKLGSVHI